MGGTAPSRTDPGPWEAWSTVFLDLLLLGFGRGETLRGAGGVATLCGITSSGIGGVGMGGGLTDLSSEDLADASTIDTIYDLTMVLLPIDYPL